MSTESDNNEDQFQKELVELFAQEAQEWLVQLHAALTELESQPTADRHIQIVDTIVRGITSLGGSAATVNLPDVERATFALLPFIDIVRDRTTATKQDYQTVRRQFRSVITSVTVATGLTLEIDSGSDESKSASTATDLIGILNALRDMQEVRSRTHRYTRNLAHLVMRRLEQEVKQGTERIERVTIQEILTEVKKGDEELLRMMHAALPDIGRLCGRLMQVKTPAMWHAFDLTPVVQEVERLHSFAKQVNATALVTFLTGLQSFLILVSKKHLVLASEKLVAVEKRIKRVVEMVQEWVDIGREEREVIDRLIAAAN